MTSVELFAYPWDVVDEGEGRFLDRCRELGIDRVHVAVSYHSGKFLLARNSRARVYFPEPGARYFPASPALWQGGLDQPVSEVAANGWLEMSAACASDRGIELSAWAVFFHNSALGARYPHLTIENAFGDRYPFALCPSRPEVQDHAADLKPLVARFHLLAYGSDPAAENSDLVFVLAMLGDPGRVNLTLNLGEPITSTFSQAAAKVEFALRQGVTRFSFFNYSFLGEARLRWIRDLACLARSQHP